MKDFLENIKFLFEEVLFIPLDFLRNLELGNWWSANTMSWFFIFIGFVAISYWIKQLIGFEKKGEENKDPSAHSFL